MNADENAPITALRSWLTSDEEGRELLARFAAHPEDEAAALAAWLEARSHDPPPQLAAEVSGGHVEKLVQIAQAGVVVLKQESSVLASSFMELLRPVLEAHSLFGGRDAELEQLDRFVVEDGRHLFVTAPSGFGKTALLAHWVRSLERRARPVAYTFVNRFGNLADEGTTLRILCQQLASLHREEGLLPASLDELRALYLRLVGKASRTSGLVVVIDGLDEAAAWRPGPGLVPRTLPAGVSIVFSAREIAARDWLSELDLSPDEVEILTVGTLGVSEIDKILASAGDRAPAWTREPEALRSIHEVSQGDPFYVRYLVEDIVAPSEEAEPRIRSLAELGQQPRGLDVYLERWWEEARAAAREPFVRDLLGYLLVARGPLRRSELTAISEDDDLDDFTVDDAVVQRFVGGSERDGFSLAHRRLRDFIAREKFGDSAQRRYRLRIIDFCSHWELHASAYALRHYAGHLAEEDSWSELAALARDPKYEAAQRRAFFDEPWLPLLVVDTAFFAAAQRSDAAGMAEFALRKSVRVAQARRESPLEVVRAASVEAAWALADLRDAETSALWHLLLAWELDDSGRTPAAQATLERLQRRDLPAISDGEMYVELFATAALDTPEYRLGLGRRLFDVEGRSALVRAYLALDALPAAVEVAATMEASDEAWSVHKDIGLALAKAGAADEGRVDLERAFSLANESTSGWRGWNLASIAQAQLEAGLIDAAIATAEAIDDQEVFASMAWSAIGVAQAAAGRSDDALAAAQRIADPTRRDSTLGGLANAAARDRSFERAGEAVERMADDAVRARALAAIAVERARIGDVDAALRELRSLGMRYEQVLGIVEIAKLRADANDHETAQRLLDEAAAIGVGVHDAQLRAAGVMAIAQAFGILGDRAHARARLAEAAEHAAGISDAGRRASVLNGCGALCAEIGELEDALELIDAARASALQIEDIGKRIGALKDLATDQAAIGFLDSARETAGVLRSEGETPPTLTWVGVERAPVRYDTDLSYAMALDEIAQAEIRLGRFDAAMRTGETMQAETRRGLGLLRVAVAQAEGGDPDSGLQTATRIDERKFRRDALAAVARAYLAQGRGPAARAAWALLIEPPDERDRERAHADVLREAARAMSQLGRFGEANATARAIAHDETRVEVLANVAAARARAGEFDDARRDADELDGDARTWALVEVLLEQLRAEDLEGAQETTNLLGDGPDRARAFASISVSAARAGDLDAAREIAREMTDAEVYSLVLMDIARAGSEMGDAAAVDALVTEAERCARAIEDVAVRKNVLEQLAAGAARLARSETAIEIADALVDVEARDKALADIASVRGHADDVEGARAIAASIVDDNRRAVLESTLAQQLARADRLDDALEAARAVNWDAARDEALHVIAETLARQGRDHEALAVAREVEGSVRRGETFTAIAAAQAQSARFDVALATADLVRDLARDHALAQIARAQATQDFPQAACDTAAAIEYGPIRDETLIAVARTRLDAADVGGALAIAATIATREEESDTLLADIALHQAAADDVDGAFRTIATLGGRHTGVWRIVLSRLHEIQDRTAIAQLVISSADDPDLAAAISYCLARAFPGEAAAVARAVDFVMSEYARAGARASKQFARDAPVSASLPQ